MNKREWHKEHGGNRARWDTDVFVVFGIFSSQRLL